MQSQALGLNGNDRVIVFLSVLILIVTPFAADSYTPSMPAIANAFHTTRDQVQLTMTWYLIGVAVSQLIYGPMSDRHGRRPIILIGLAITIVGSLLCATANTLTFLLGARLIQGIGAGVCNGLFRAVLRDSFSGAKMSRVGSYAGMFYTIAFALAPIFGGYIQYYLGWRENFLFITFVVFTITFALSVMLPETNLKLDITATRAKIVLRNYASLIASPHFLGYTFISSLAFSGLIAYYTAAPFLMQNVIGLSSVEFGWLSLGLAIGMFVGQYLNAKYVAKRGINPLLLFGLFMMFGSGVLMWVLGEMGFLNTFVVITPVIIFSIAAGLVFSNAMTNAFQYVGYIAGAAGGMYGFLQIIGASFTSVLVSGFHAETQIPLAMVYTALGACSLVLYFLLTLTSKPVIED